MSIVCKIHNRCATDFPQLLLRKFYQVVFLEKDLKTLKIYSAIVIGSEKSNNREILTKSFGINIEYSFNSTHSNNISITAKHSNKGSSFGNDVIAWKKVWGSKTKILSDPDALKKEYDVNFISTDMPSTVSNNNDYLLISDDTFTKDKDTIAKNVNYSELEAINSYGILSDINLSKGLEIVNFTLTEVKLSTQISNLLEYHIEFQKDQEFEIKDFSLYFVLPDGYVTQNEKEAFTIKNDNTDTKINLNNPFETLGNNTPSYIKEWIELGIEDRKYFRIYNPLKLKTFNTKNDIILNNETIPNFYKILIATTIQSTINPLINQLLYGFVIAIFFSYGLDQTRLMNFRELFWGYCKISPDINFTLTFGLLLLSLLFKISLGKKEEERFIYWTRIVSLIAGLFWLLIMYGCGGHYFYSNVFLTIPHYFPQWIITTSHILNIITFCLSFLSCFWLYIYYKNEITFTFKKQLKQIISRK